jgi:hypothetical protein
MGYRRSELDEIATNFRLCRQPYTIFQLHAISFDIMAHPVPAAAIIGSIGSAVGTSLAALSRLNDHQTSAQAGTRTPGVPC